MNSQDELHVVFGASGAAGSAVVHELAARDKRVRAVTRSGWANDSVGVESVKGDAPSATSRPLRTGRRSGRRWRGFEGGRNR